MSHIAFRVKNLGKQDRMNPREPYKALRDIITDAFACLFRCLWRNSHFEVRNSQSEIRDPKMSNSVPLTPSASRLTVFECHSSFCNVV